MRKKLNFADETVVNRGYPTATLRLEFGKATGAILERPGRCVQRSWSLTTFLPESIHSSTPTYITSSSTSRRKSPIASICSSQSIILNYLHIWSIRMPSMLLRLPSREAGHVHIGNGMRSSILLGMLGRVLELESDERG